MAEGTAGVMVDDPTTAELMEGVNEARILLASDAHRRELAELADISRKFVEMQERYKALQASIDGRNAVYAKAEAALHAHLATKHRVEAPKVETPATDDPGAAVKVRPRPGEGHAANCAVYFDDPCDCQ